MCEATHTPGPWSIVEHSWSDTGIDSATDYVCLLRIDPSDEECEVAMSNRMAANARLIAAAPELLEACKSFSDHLTGPTAWTQDQEDALIERVHAAIAKATGASNV